MTKKQTITNLKKSIQESEKKLDQLLDSDMTEPNVKKYYQESKKLFESKSSLQKLTV